MALIEFSQKKNRTFLNVKGGVMFINSQDPETNGHSISGVSGTLMSIHTRVKEIKGHNIKFYDFFIDDGTEGYNLSVGPSVAKSLIMSLVTVENFAGNRIEINVRPSKDGQYSNAFVNCNGVKLNWAAPRNAWPTDDRQLDILLDNYINEINTRLRGTTFQDPGAPAQAPQAPEQKAPTAPAAPAAPANPAQGQAAPVDAAPIDDYVPVSDDFDDMPQHI